MEDLEPLLITLTAQPEFATFRGHVDGYGTPMSPSAIFPMLLKVLAEKGADAAAAWIQKIVATETAQAKCYFLLSGLKDLNSGIRLSPSLRLERFDQLEPTQAVEMFRPIALGSGGWVHQQLPADVVLVWNLQVPQLVTRASEGVLNAALQEMEQIIHLLGIFHDAIRPEVGWCDYNDPDLRALRVGVGYRPASTEARQFVGMPERPLARTYHRLATAYETLDERERLLIGVAAQRLNEATQRRRVGDRAIDASICLEALLGDDDEKLELSKTIRTRAALVLGGDLEKRRRNRDAVKALYNTRSKMVHTGRLPTKLNHDSVVEPGVAVARKILLARLLGGKPNWDHLELLGDVGSSIGLSGKTPEPN